MISILFLNLNFFNTKHFKGKTVLFYWDEIGECHNIFRVTLPTDIVKIQIYDHLIPVKSILNKFKYPLRIIDSDDGFNSGQALMKSEFLYRFEKEGTFCVKSEGALNCHCLIKVLQNPARTEAPKFKNQEPQIVYKYHKVYLECTTSSSTIHYSYGSTPNKLSYVKIKMKTSFYLV